MKGMTAEEATKMYQAFKHAGLLESNAAAAVDAQIEAERQAEHERRRKARMISLPSGHETEHGSLAERVTKLEEVVAWQGKALAELTALHKRQAQDSDDDWLYYTDHAKWRAQQAAARARMQQVMQTETKRLDDQIMAGYCGADAQGPRLIREIMDR